MKYFPLALACLVAVATAQSGGASAATQSQKQSQAAKKTTEMKFNQDLRIVGDLTCNKLTVSSNAHFTNMEISKDVTATKVQTTTLVGDEVKVTRITSPTGVIVIDADVLFSDIVDDTQGGTSLIEEQVKKYMQIFQHDDFAGNYKGWSIMKTVQCDALSFLGGPCVLGGTQGVTKTLSGLPNHTRLRLEGNMLICGDWEDCSVIMKVDGQVVWTRNFNTSGKAGIKVCDCIAHEIGVQVFNNERAIDVQVTHSASSVNIEFSTTCSKPACDSSYGISDFMVLTME